MSHKQIRNLTRRSRERAITGREPDRCSRVHYTFATRTNHALHPWSRPGDPLGVRARLKPRTTLGETRSGRSLANPLGPRTHPEAVRASASSEAPLLAGTTRPAVTAGTARIRGARERPTRGPVRVHRCRSACATSQLPHNVTFTISWRVTGIVFSSSQLQDVDERTGTRGGFERA